MQSKEKQHLGKAERREALCHLPEMSTLWSSAVSKQQTHT